MTDAQIVELYHARDEKAIRETQTKYQKYLMKIAFNVLHDPADSEESVNDTYLAAWNSMPPQRPAVLSAYLGKLTRRISIDLFRKKNRQKRKGSEYTVSLTELEECVSGGETPEEGLELKELADAISRAHVTLPES